MSLSLIVFFVMRRSPPRSTLFPYATLFRSSYEGSAAEHLVRSGHPAVKAAAPRFSLFDAYVDFWTPGGLQPGWVADARSEEHTSELQSHVNLVCRLLLEKKKKKNRLIVRAA